MSKKIINELHDEPDEINLYDVFRIIWNKKYLIIVTSFLFTLSSIIYSLYLANVYTSKAILVPSNQEDSLGSKLSQFSGLAGIAGVNIPTDNSSKSQEAIERIKSFDFFQHYILPNINLEDLIAVKKWQPESNKIIYDKNVFDSNSKKWVRNVSYPKKTIPTAQEAYIEKYTEILNIIEDKKTGFISINIEHKSAVFAKQLLDIIISNINESMRELDKENAQNSINFLNAQSKNTSVQSLKDAISKLLETQMQTLMLASSNESYIFKIIESPYISEEHSGPNRLLIIFITGFFGFLFSLLIIFIQHFLRNTKSNLRNY